MAKKVVEQMNETKMDVACRAIECCILPVFLILCFVKLNFALCCAGIAGLWVSAWKLLKAYLKHNK